MTYALATACDTPNTLAIMDAIYDIAMNKSDVTGVKFAKGKKWGMPTTGEVGGKFPFFVVLQPEPAGSAEGGLQRSAQEIRRNVAGQWEPIWDFTCFAIFAKRDVTKPQTFTTPEDMKNKLVRAYMMFYTLQNTCASSSVLSPSVGPLKVTPIVAGPQQQAAFYTGVVLTIRAFENLEISYDQ